MTTLHMETDAVRAMAAQIKQGAESMRSQMQALNGSAQSVDWMGPSRDEFVAEVAEIVRQIDGRVEAGVVLAGRVENEVAEWEETAQQLSGSASGVGNPDVQPGDVLGISVTMPNEQKEIDQLTEEELIRVIAAEEQKLEEIKQKIRDIGGDLAGRDRLEMWFKIFKYTVNLSTIGLLPTGDTIFTLRNGIDDLSKLFKEYNAQLGLLEQLHARKNNLNT